MRSYIALAALFAAAGLAACGGGGSTSAPVASPATSTPSPAPSNSPAGTKRLVLTWVGASHARGAASDLRHIRDTLNTQGPIAIGVDPSTTPVNPAGTILVEAQPGGSTNTATLVVQELNASGTPIPAPSPVVAAPSAIATASPAATTATATDFAITAASSSSIGAGTTTVQTSDGLSASIGTQVLPNLGLSTGTVYKDATLAIAFDANGQPQPVTNTAQADLYMTPAGSGKPAALNAPYGFEDLTNSGLGIADYSAAPVTFTSQGTAVVAPSFLPPASGGDPTTSLIAARTAAGKTVLLSVTVSSCSGDPTLCDAGLTVFGSWKLF
jgi:hypothetical protein